MGVERLVNFFVSASTAEALVTSEDDLSCTSEKSQPERGNGRTYNLTKLKGREEDVERQLSNNRQTKAGKTRSRFGGGNDAHVTIVPQYLQYRIKELFIFHVTSNQCTKKSCGFTTLNSRKDIAMTKCSDHFLNVFSSASKDTACSSVG